ncbi:MAG: PD-(D/E)XK nuclease family protein, partial [Oscillospiraceae bacterium]|nr:PD-(D/E)XK nuclease family protein [Oscillospiraceae bacterium]
EELRPSETVAWLRERFPLLTPRDTALLRPLERLEGENAGFALLCEERRKGGSLYASLLDYFRSKEAYAPRLEALERVTQRKAAELRIEDTDAAALLFRARMTLSPSRAESYANCPFQYFCAYGMKAKPRRVADFDPLFRGNAVHTVLERLLRETGVEALLAMEPAARAQCLDRVMETYSAAYLDMERLPARVGYLFRRLRDILLQVLERMIHQFAASAFRPVAFELPIDWDSAVKPYEIAFEGGIVSLRGKADRVDCATVNGQTFFRVTDYKSGSKQFSLGEVFEGFQLQLLVYLFSLWQSDAAPFKGALPGGILYERAKDPVLSAGERERSPAEIAAQKQKQNRADGLLLQDEALLLAMERDGLGLYLPARRMPDGAFGGKLVTLAGLGKLKGRVDAVLAEMAARLRQGNIAALPYQAQGEKEACAFCDYQAVCGREAGEAVRTAAALSFEEALASLEQEGGAPDAVDGGTAAGD